MQASFSQNFFEGYDDVPLDDDLDAGALRSCLVAVSTVSDENDPRTFDNHRGAAPTEAGQVSNGGQISAHVRAIGRQRPACYEPLPVLGCHG